MSSCNECDYDKILSMSFSDVERTKKMMDFWLKMNESNSDYYNYIHLVKVWKDNVNICNIP